MRIGRRGGLLLACGLSSVLALSVLAPPGVSAQVQAAPPLGGAAQGGAATAGQPGPDGPAAGDSHLVTLVTGDVVRVSGKGKDSTAQVVTDVAPQGDVRIITQGDELFALPGVAAPLLAAGQLDVRLFNLSLLVRDGYTDDKIKQLPLIVDYKVPDGAQPPTEPVDGAQVRRRLPIAGAVAMGVDKKQGTKFWSAVTEPVKGARSGAAAPLTMAPRIKKVWLDGKVKASDDVSRVAIGADKAWTAGFDGAGVPVAVLDTGVDAGHADLAGKVIEAQNFVPADQPGGDSPTDRYGHGTHVASIIAGTGARSDGKNAGTAPKAGLFNGKVLNDDGGGYDSWIIAGMEWAAGKAKIVNMSLGGCCTDGTDPMSQALNEISRRTGALFVTSAGNSGPVVHAVGTPAVADEALAVGAKSRDGASWAAYSSWGPRAGDFAIKPEISAPGTNILAASANNDDNVICSTDPVCDGSGYMQISGTSMAAPHVAAAAAIVRQQHPDWTAQQIRDALTSTATPNEEFAWVQGAGLADVGRAVTQKLHATGILNLGVDLFPSETQTGTITYTNSGDAPVTLDLTSQFWRPNTGTTAQYFRGQTDWTPPAGAVKVEPAQVSVPAGGTATATVKIDNTLTPFGTFYGRLTADGPNGVKVATTLSFTHDPERHKLVVNATDMAGNAPDPLRSLAIAKGGDVSSLWVQYFDEGEWWRDKWINMQSGVVGDLPADTYRIFGSVGQFLDRIAIFAGWTVQHDQDRVLPIETRQAREFQIRTDRPSINEATTVTYADGDVEYSEFVGQGYGLYQALGPQPAGVTVKYASIRIPQPLELRSGDSRQRIPAFLPRDEQAVYTDNWTCFGCRKKLPTDGDIVLVDAGDGSPQSLAGADLRGKVALIREKPRTDGEDDALLALIDDEVRAATEAGAVGVVLAVDAGSPVRYAAWDHKIWVTVVSPADGAALAKLVGKRPAKLRADSNTPAAYDYQVQSSPAQAVTDPVYTIAQDSLATVTTRFHAAYPGEPGDDTVRFGVGPRITAGTLPLVRTEYVMPGSEKLTDSHCSVTRELPAPAQCRWTAAGFRPAVAAGQQVTRNLMKAPMVPQQALDLPFAMHGWAGLYWRHGVGDYNDPVLGAGEGSGGLWFWGNNVTNRTRVYRGDQQLCDTPSFPKAFGPAECHIKEPGSYRVVVDTTLDPYPLSTRTSTEWSLNYNPDPETRIPLVMTEYRLPVDLNNAVPAKRHQAPIQLGYQRGGPAAPAKWAVKVWATFDDGATWQPVFDGKAGSKGLVEPTINPPKKHNGFVGLRVKADDGQGNGIDQTVIRAYYLR
ncbi:S8 family serine peptidase [Nonomuraea antimicrobica]|uniref:S8 family serine peptidase n=2 Tax=Nonomuraea antimicrobica TaxID=561173 RepID=A0ABP7BWL2_9ACTN